MERPTTKKGGVLEADTRGASPHASPIAPTSPMGLGTV